MAKSKVVGYLPNDQPPIGQMILLGFQHVLTMFPATVFVAALCGFHVGTVLTVSGVGTVVALLLSKWRLGKFIPLFYGSSFSYIAAYLAIVQQMTGELPQFGVPVPDEVISTMQGGIVVTGLLNLLVGFIIRAVGKEKIDMILPPVVTGSVAAIIGFAELVQAAGHENGERGRIIGRSARHMLAMVNDLIDYARANPGKLNYGSAGSGTTHHLSVELFKTMTKTFMVHIPYRGAGPLMVDLLAGQVDLAFDGMGTSSVQIKAGKLIPLAVSSVKRNPVLPNVPTVAEAGVPGYEVRTWYAIWAIKGTPKDIKDRMYKDVVAAMNQPDLKKIWAEQGADPGGMPPAEMEKLVKSEIAKWAKVVKDAGAKVDN